MIPMAAGYGQAGQYLQSLSLVNVGGLVASTLLSLLLLPILYKMLTLKKKPEEHLDVDC
jgi:Cu/Ag efflux pump CusA